MAEIYERILNELYFDLAVPRDRLTIRFHNGYVILSGEVEWPYQKTCAEADVRRVLGVTGVTNDISGPWERGARPRSALAVSGLLSPSRSPQAPRE
jgi:BON domain